MILESIFSAEFLSATFRATTPILFATLAASIASKCGITNMALEGMMLFGALFGVIFTAMFQNLFIGFLITMIIGGFIGLFFAFFVLKLKTDSILAAIAINLMATGGTILILLLLSGDRGISTSIKSLQMPNVVIPGINQIPIIGNILSGQNLLTYLSFFMVLFMHIFLYKTPLGLRIRAVGENKDAAESVGISSKKIQYIALIISGVLASMGGFFLSGGYMSYFTTSMTAGRGFIALAASAMGGNTPVGGFLVSLIFGGAQSIANILQLGSWPYELVDMLPYVTTIIGLAIYSYIKMRKRQKMTNN